MFGFVSNNKIINRELNMYVTSVRVPVKVGHMGIMNIEFNDDIDIENFKNSLRNFTPLKKKFKNLYTAPKNPVIIHDEENRPQHKMDLSNGMEIHVGRLEYKNKTCAW